MRRKFVVVGLAALGLAAGTVRFGMAETAGQPEYTSAQIKKMVREAHSVEQFTVLADYYAAQQRMYKQKAIGQMRLWRERSEMWTPLSEKYPRPVDSARNLHDYYEYKAPQSAALQAKYGQLEDTMSTNGAEPNA